MEKDNSRRLLRKMAIHQLTDEETAALEELAKSDPFLQEAIEGYQNYPSNYRETLSQIRSALPRNVVRRHHWSIAATILFVVAAGWLVYQFGGDSIRTQSATDLSSSTGEISSESDAQRVTGTMEQQSSSLEEFGEELERQGSFETAALKDDVGESQNPERRLRQEASNSAASVVAKENEIVFKGFVQDETGHRLSEVIVEKIPQGQETLTAPDGHFELIASERSQILRFRHEDYHDLILLNLIESDSDVTITLHALMTKSGTSRLTKAQTSKSVAFQAEHWQAFQEYVKSQQKYPPEARDLGIAGIVQLQLAIDPRGVPTDVKVVRSLGYGCDEEAIRLVLSSPVGSWPGRAFQGAPKLFLGIGFGESEVPNP